MNTTETKVTHTPHDIARRVVDAVSSYLDNTAQKHNCVGFDCATCALNGYRYAEAISDVEDEIKTIPVIAAAPDMLEALELIVKVTAPGVVETNPQAIQVAYKLAQAAIARAA